MLNDFIVVESAISAFNNAALWMPAFLWWTILTLPLFVVVYWCHSAITNRIGWKRENILNKSATWVAGLTCAWAIMFGGNYSVLRDSLSVLPMMMATILFLTSLCVSSHMHEHALPRMNWWRWVLVGGILLVVGASDTHAWWGPILQICAIVIGAALGRIARGKMRPVAGLVLIMMTVAIAMLMQPEFFRFGQLGNLTPVHLLAMLGLGGACMITVALRNINPQGKIRHSIYIKLKWLMRVVCALGVALFILTEAVPVFVGTMIALLLSISLSVWHSNNVNPALAEKTFAIAIMTFGAITVMPAITAIGILYWANTDYVRIWDECKGLL